VVDRHYKALALTENLHQSYEIHLTPTWLTTGLIHMYTIMALRGARHYACHNTPCESYMYVIILPSVEPAHDDPPQYTAAVRETSRSISVY